MISKNIIIPKLLFFILVIMLISSSLFVHCNKNSTAPEETSPIVGGWQRSSYGVYEDFDCLVFYANGYVLYWISANLNEPQDTCGGIEIGTYVYDAENQSITVDILLDQNGVNGLADNGENYFDGSGDLELYLSNDLLIIHNNMSNQSSSRTKIESNTNPLVGSWGICRYNNSSPEYSSMTFCANSIYIAWLSNDPANPKITTGVEAGAYSINQQTGALYIQNCLIDESDSDGFWGHGAYANWSHIAYAFNNDTLKINVDGEDIWSGPKVR